MAAAASTFGKIASEILMMNRPEVGEVSEPVGEGKVGSSTMPHKKNPVKSEGTVGLAKMLRSHAHLMQELMEGHDERDAAGRWSSPCFQRRSATLGECWRTPRTSLTVWKSTKRD